MKHKWIYARIPGKKLVLFYHANESYYCEPERFMLRQTLECFKASQLILLIERASILNVLEGIRATPDLWRKLWWF